VTGEDAKAAMAVSLPGMIITQTSSATAGEEFLEPKPSEVD
jgi:hypothetical protein